MTLSRLLSRCDFSIALKKLPITKSQHVNQSRGNFNQLICTRDTSNGASSIPLPFSEIPKSPRVPFLGSLPYFLTKGGQAKIHEYAEDIHKKIGPIFLDKLGGKEILFISNPDDNLQVYRCEGQYPQHFVFDSWTLFLKESGMKRGLFFMDGPEWLKNRQILNKLLLQPRNMEPHCEGLMNISKDLMDIWKSSPPGMDLDYHLYSWNLESIGHVVLGQRLGFLENLTTSESGGPTRLKDDEFVNSIYETFVESAKLYSIPATFAKNLRLPSWKRFCRAVTTSLQYGYRYIEKGIEELRIDEKSFSKNCLVYKLLIENRLSESDAKILLVDLFLASADTTSSAATWVLYLLGRNPGVAQKAREDLLKRLNGNTLSLNDLADNAYLRGIIKESLRLHPVASFLTRNLAKETVLHGYQVPAGTMVISSLYSIGRDANNFSSPDEFRPERWFREATSYQPDEQSILNKKAYTPWGLGGRSCVGKRLAELELSTLIASALLNFKWTVPEPIEMELRIVSVPSKKVILDLEPLG